MPANSPHKTLADLIAAMRAAPGKLNFASGTAAYQVAMEMFHERNGMRGTSVDYKGTGPAINDVMSGVCGYSIAEASAVMGLIKGGKLRALAIAAAQRHRAHTPHRQGCEHSGRVNYEAAASRATAMKLRAVGVIASGRLASAKPTWNAVGSGTMVSSRTPSPA